MVTLESSLLNGRLVSIREALKLKSVGDSPDFRCPECLHKVRAHKSGGHISAHFEHLRRNPDCSFSHIRARSHSETGQDDQAWTDEELRASVVVYLTMLEQTRAGLNVVKKKGYVDLASRFNRTAKSFEYRMQNISYVLALLGRTWRPGLPPARNVGPKVGAKLEHFIAELEGRTASGIVAFEIEVKNARRQGSKPKLSKDPARTNVTVTQYVRDPKVKAWVLAQADGICECCSLPAPFATADGPFLEVHHIRHLADRGSDTISNAIAICPNCHRRLHYSLGAAELVETLYSKIDRLIREDSAKKT